ncbi:MAG: hypothetical protein ACXAHE_22090 [Roseburia sp. 1XD42-69]
MKKKIAFFVFLPRAIQIRCSRLPQSLSGGGMQSGFILLMNLRRKSGTPEQSFYPVILFCQS